MKTPDGSVALVTGASSGNTVVLLYPGLVRTEAMLGVHYAHGRGRPLPATPDAGNPWQWGLSARRGV